MKNPDSRFTFHVSCIALFIGLVAFACAVGTRSAQAQSYSIDWFTIDGGGGASIGGVYSLSGTVGQPDTGVMTGGQYSLAGGFWSLIATVPTPGAPTLTVTLTSTNTVLICWPSPSTDFVLQQKADLLAPNWVTVVQTPADNGTIKCLTISPSAGNLFYRLKK